MAFTPGNDINILQATDSLNVGAGAGDDRYILSANQLTATQVINISDTEGANVLHLIGGLTIASSKVSANAIQLILSNGATVNIFGADTFTYWIGGDSLTGVGAVERTFASFVTASLGLAAVPTGTAVVDGPANVDVKTDGTTTSGGVAPATFTLTSVDSVNEGEAATFTVTASAAVVADTTVTFQLKAGDATAANQGTTTTNLNDFGAGAFNLVTKTIPAGQTSVTFDVTALADNITELTETYSVEVKVGATTLTKTVSVLDGQVGAGQTYTLTTGADNIPGTVGNDIINGFSAAGANAATDTLTVTDIIDGGAGTDTLNITNTADATSATAGAQIKNVEIINIRQATAAQTSNHDASTTAGVTAVNSNVSAGIVTVTNLATGASAGVIGNGTLVNGAFNPGYVAAATAATLNITDGTKGGAVTLSGTGLTSTTVNSTGAANTIGALTLAGTTTSLTIDATTKLTTGALTNAGTTNLATLTVKGAGAVDLSANALQTGVTKIDASANTGGLTVTLSDKVTIAVTGSKGNDVITTNAILTTGSVNAGDGIDTLDIDVNVGHANTASLAAKYTNFEILRVNGTFDASLIAGITAIEIADVAADSNISKMTATQAGAVTVRNANTQALTLALNDSTGTADVLSITTGIGGTTAAAATNIGALTVTGFETLNVTAAPGSTSTTGANRTTTINSFATATHLTAINLKGTAVTLADAATVKAVTIDGTALTGNGANAPIGLTITGNLVAGSVVKGSATAGNTFNLGTAGSTYTGGAGKDAFNITAATQLRNGATYNKIDGGAGEDTLTLTAGANVVTMVDDDFKEIANIEKLVVGNTGVNAINITTGGWYDASFKAAGSDLTITNNDVGSAVSFTGGTFTGNQTLTLTTEATTATTSVLTGSGNDVVKVNATAATTGDITINTGAGNDTIELTVSAALAAGQSATINGGAGKDAITITGLDAADAVYVSVVVGAGESTVANYDSITGFSMGTATRSVLLDFADAAVAAGNLGNTGITGYTAGELVYSITNGVLSFSGTSAAGLTLGQKANLVDTLITTNLNTVAFTHNTNTYVYNENVAGDSLIELVGITGVTNLGVVGDGTTVTTINIA